MATSKKIDNCGKFRPNSALKRNGAVWRRFIFKGLEADSGAERMFFVELEMVNPYLSPDEVVLGFKSRSKISEDDLQYALAGTKAAHELRCEPLVTPSYVAVRAGSFGLHAKQLCSYHAVKSVSGGFKLAEIAAGKCIFTDNYIRGEISRTSSEIREHPEYLCDSGCISWNIQYEIKYSFPPGYEKKTDIWVPNGARTDFTGSLTLDGLEYHIIPKTSCGYIDFHAGHSLPLPWIHLSSSALTSLISGKKLFNSCFSVQGLYEERLALYVVLEDNSVLIKAKNDRHSINPVWECTRMPMDEEGERLHWSVSVDTKKWVVDIDIMCLVKELFVRNIELPEGRRKVMKQLAGGTGTGEIRLYRHVGKNLELIEDAHVANALCEYGQFELPEE